LIRIGKYHNWFGLLHGNGRRQKEKAGLNPALFTTKERIHPRGAGQRDRD